MKSFMQPRSGVLRPNPSTENISSPNPSPHKQRSSRKHKENAPPPDPNALTDWTSSSSPAAAKSTPTGKSRSPLPPRPPTSNSIPLKRKLNLDTVPENGVTGNSDSGVKVIVRIRPPNKEEEEDKSIVQNVSSDSLSFLGQTFSFDSVADSGATQQDIFELVGAPLVENCLAGFNSSIFAYGQTGSGKTYTMCGPANALLEDNLSSKQGLTPRVFEKLFARINEEQIKHADKQLKYQCRCSFLEIYNEQITDLLDPNQKNLQVREDVKIGVYVENLTEEYVGTMKAVKQLLIKGLSNRRTGATSLNAESSRSHSVFTCVVESRCKSMADGLSSFRTSRINLVDLAGSERQKLTGAAGERLKEAGNINRSLSQLGNLINILAEVSQTGKQRHIPYRDSRLTFLLQESLGGNAKLAMICAVSLAESCKSETHSTLRFAQRAKAIKNKAVVNEVMQDDVNVLREVIRQLKDELLQMKANGNSANTNGSYSTGWNARRSLNLLKFSLNRSMTLPHIEDDGDVEMEIDEEAVERLCIQVGLQSAGFEENDTNDVRNLTTCQSDSKVEAHKESILAGEKQIGPLEIGCGSDQGHEETEIHMQDCQLEEIVSEEFNNKHKLLDGCREPLVQAPSSPKIDGLNHNTGEPIQEKLFVTSDHQVFEVLPGRSGETRSSADLAVDGGLADVFIADSSHNSPTSSPNSVLPLNLSIVPSESSQVHQSPTLSVSPRINNSSSKSLMTTSMLSASQKSLREKNCLGLDVLQLSVTPPSTKTMKSSLQPTEHLAASLNRGLQVIDSHIQSSALRRSSFRFSCIPVDTKPVLPVDKVDVGVQALLQDPETSAFLCSKCMSRASQGESKEANDHSGLQLVPVDGSDSTEISRVLVPECMSRASQGESKEVNDCSGLQLVPVDGSDSAEISRVLVPKAVEKVLTGAIRREMELEKFSSKQATEIRQLNRLVQQYKHERECNAVIEQMREDKIIRLESLMDNILPTEEYMEQELVSLMHEHKLFKEKYENHPEVLRTKVELKRVQDELDTYRNFFDMGERDVLLEEIQHLKSQLQYYICSSPMPARKQSPLLQLTYPCESTSGSLCVIPELNEENASERSKQENHHSSCMLESTEESVNEKFEEERCHWIEAESKWISLSEELRIELEATRSVAEKQKQELDAEKRCCEELKEALQMAMQGHARILEQLAELEERHMALLARHRKIQEGVGDVKKAAAKAGVKGAESKFINSLAAEVSTLKVEKEREVRYLREENKGLQAQLRDTAEAVQAAGELLVRLKEAEEASTISQKRAVEAEHKAEKAYKQIDKLKKKLESGITSTNQLAESPLEVSRPIYDDSYLARYDGGESLSGADDHQRREEFTPFHHGEDGELSKLAEPSWFSGYDRCNV